MRRITRSTTTGRRSIIAGCVVLALALTACGGDDDDSSGAAPDDSADDSGGDDTGGDDAGGDDAGGDDADESSDDTTAGDDDTGDDAAEDDAADAGSDDADDAAPDTTSADDGGDDATCANGSGGEITMGTGNLAAGLDPTVALGTGSSGGTELTAFYDTLLRYIPDTGEFVPHVAESVESNDDLTEWTVVLRDGVTFGNGDPLTADDVQFSIERLAASARAAAGLAQEIVGFEVIDDQTIVLTTATPNGTVPYTLSTEVGMMVNPAVVEERGEAFPTEATGAGVGPFELERFAPGEEISLVAKDDYWGGEVCLDSVRFVNIPGGQATWDAFRAGELDVVFLSEMTVINDAREAGAEAHSQFSGGNGFLMLNNREGAATADPRVRQAIVLAVDTDVINDRASNGEGLPTKCLAHPDQEIHPDVECPGFDPDAARALVEEAKADGWDGTVELVFRDTPRSIDVSIAVEAMLTSVGMDVVRENADTTTWFERVLAPPYQFDVGEYGLALLDNGPIARMNQFFSDSVRNRSGYGSEAMDAALAELQIAETPEELKAAMGPVQEIWNEDAIALVYDASEWFIAAQDSVEDLIFNRDVTVMFQDAHVAE